MIETKVLLMVAGIYDDFYNSRYKSTGTKIVAKLKERIIKLKR